MNRQFLVLYLLCIPFVVLSQNIGIGTTEPHPSALLQIDAPNKGLLIPRVVLTQLNNSTSPINNPAIGLLVYNTGSAEFFLTTGFYFWNGSSWTLLARTSDITNSMATAWRTFGNAPADASSFIGTTNFMPLFIRVNNRPSGIIDSLFERTTFGYASQAPQVPIGVTAIGARALANANFLSFNNSAFGRQALTAYDSGSNNMALGAFSAAQLLRGNDNSFVGYSAGKNITVSNYNTAIGSNATVANNITGATAIGYQAFASGNNVLVLGSINGQNGSATSAKVGIGTPSPTFRLHIMSDDAQNSGHLQGIMVENNQNLTGEAAINFRNSGADGTGNNYWIAGLNQNRNFAFAYGTDFNVSTTRAVIDSTGRMGVGVINPTQKMDINGNLKINGELYNGGIVANLIPIVYGNVSSSGNIQSGTANFTVNKTSTGIYDVTLTGNSYTTSAYTVSISAVGNSPRIGTSTAFGALLRIQLFDAAGSLADGGFHFVVYKP